MSRFVVKIDKYDKIIYYDLLMREIKIVNKNSLNTKKVMIQMKELH